MKLLEITKDNLIFRLDCPPVSSQDFLWGFYKPDTDYNGIKVKDTIYPLY